MDYTKLIKMAQRIVDKCEANNSELHEMSNNIFVVDWETHTICQDYIRQNNEIIETFKTLIEKWSK